MRLGSNPSKEEGQLENRHTHRVAIPVYIPNTEGYFQDGIAVLRLCVESVLLTKHEACAVTLIDNGCCAEAREALLGMAADGRIDQLVLNQDNQGKIDSLIGVFRSCHEPLITLADADVLFLPGWIDAVERTMCQFPEAGLVSPCPIPASWTYANSATILSGLMGRHLKMQAVLAESDVRKFSQSIGTDLYSRRQLFCRQQLVFQRRNDKALVGCGHFVATLRRDVLPYVPSAPSLVKITGNSEQRYIDFPVDIAGYWRLGTPGIFAHHMGNRLEPWMEKEMSAMRGKLTEPTARFVPHGRRPYASLIPYWLRSRMVSRLLRMRPFRSLFLRIAGAPSSVDVAPG